MSQQIWTVTGEMGANEGFTRCGWIGQAENEDQALEQFCRVLDPWRMMVIKYNAPGAPIYEIDRVLFSRYVLEKAELSTEQQFGFEATATVHYY